jgi:arsenate reductase (thioredoxin)
MPKRKVLFLCTGNSCRSQMAEALINARLYEQWEAYSAGTHPTGFVHPMAIQALDEIEIVHRGTSKSVENFRSQSFDLVITVCDSAAEECPVWLGQGKRMHIGFPDPAKVTGSDDQKMAAFREVLDEIANKIIPILRGDPSRP